MPVPEAFGFRAFQNRQVGDSSGIEIELKNRTPKSEKLRPPLLSGDRSDIKKGQGQAGSEGLSKRRAGEWIEYPRPGWVWR